MFTVVSLPPGDRKSAVFADAIFPVQEAERREKERMTPIIAEKAAERQVLESRLRTTVAKAAKAEDPAEVARYRDEAKQTAKELAARHVPDPPQFYCDDVPPEKLAKLLARQGGRMLQASAEGTAFEIVKGRYSGTANFEVYLKGHAGDAHRADRIGREQDAVDRPALSLALAVQPDVIRGLAETPSLRGRGFLARFLYFMPVSLVGRRSVAPAPVPGAVAEGYRNIMTNLWELPGGVDEVGRPAPNWLRFSPGADRAMQAFESWLEPQLAEGEELSHLAGWANKLAGAIARIAGILHVVDAVDRALPWQEPIREDTVAAAIRLGRDYLLPHALAAFGIMGADPRIELAKEVLDGLARSFEGYECFESAPPTVSRREIHQRHRTRSRFKTVEELDPVFSLLVQLGWLSPVVTRRRNTGGRPAGPSYWVNPAIMTLHEKSAPRTQNTHNTQNADTDGRADAREGLGCSPFSGPLEMRVRAYYGP